MEELLKELIAELRIHNVLLARAILKREDGTWHSRYGNKTLLWDKDVAAQKINETLDWAKEFLQED